MDISNSYWNDKGKYQSDYDRLSELLVPVQGKCETFGGELLRAVGRLYHDAYNNGFLNNTSGALNFLRETSWGSSEEWSHVYELLSEKVNTGDYSDLCEETQKGLELLVNLVVEWVLANSKEAGNLTNDLFDFQDETFYEEDEYDWHSEQDDEMEDCY